MECIVLYGGVSGERAVSLRSGSRVAEALRGQGFRVTLWDWRGEHFGARRMEKLARADAVFLALHGGAGENGTLQALLEAHGVRHYTGTGPVGAARAMNKRTAREMAAVAGVPVARGALWEPGGRAPALTLPFVAKPLCGGSSVGLQFFKTAQDVARFSPTEPLLCEEYLPGREFTVGILDGRALPVVEISPVNGTYDYAHKYTAGATREYCPAPIDARETAALTEGAFAVFRALGLRDYARMDFKADGHGRFCFLEANTLPGMTETSLLPLSARTAGIDYGALCRRMAMLAAARKKRY